MATKVLVTGRPGSGKTTVVRGVAARLGCVAGGFWTEEIREHGVRVGFRVKDIHSGEEGILAHISRKGGPRVGKYGVDVASFERIGVGALRAAMHRDGCVVIDEIGRMELLSEAFSVVVTEVLDSGHPVVGTVPVYRHAFLDGLRRRKDLTFLEITPANREALVDRIVGLL